MSYVLVEFKMRSVAFSEGRRFMRGLVDPDGFGPSLLFHKAKSHVIQLS